MESAGAETGDKFTGKRDVLSVERTETGRTLHIPAEAGYGITEWSVAMPKK